MAEIVLLHGSGESPRKIEYSVNATMQDGYVARVALQAVQPDFLGGGLLLHLESQLLVGAVAEVWVVGLVPLVDGRRDRVVERVALTELGESVGRLKAELRDDSGRTRGERRRGAAWAVPPFPRRRQ